MTTETELKVPFGKTSSGVLVTVSEADGASEYFCPGCESKLVLRDGEIRKKHFAHPVDSLCTQETILHRTAKALLAAVVEENASHDDRSSVYLACECDWCQQSHTVELTARTFSGVSVEKTVGSYVCDVVAARSGGDALAIEVVVTHRMEQRKATDLSLPWIELNAGDVITNPRRWSPIRSKIKATICTNCKENNRRVQAVADRWGVDRGIYSPLQRRDGRQYVAAVERCFKCKEEIPVFWWSGIPFCESTPPEPRPRTIARRFSKQYGGAYWANTCANCGVIQGDNYLFLFEGAVLAHLPRSDSFQKQQSSAAVSEFMKIVTRNLGS